MAKTIKLRIDVASAVERINAAGMAGSFSSLLKGQLLHLADADGGIVFDLDVIEDKPKPKRKRSKKDSE